MGIEIQDFFFYACATQRRKLNIIKRIKDAEGILRSKEGEISRAFKNHSKVINTTTEPNSAEIEGCLQGIDQRVPNDLKFLIQLWKYMKH